MIGKDPDPNEKDRMMPMLKGHYCYTISIALTNMNYHFTNV